MAEVEHSDVLTICDQGSGSGGEDELDNCKEFFSQFLEPLSRNVRREAIELMHNLRKRDADTSHANEQCTNLIIKVEKELGSQHIICQAIAKELVESLRKLNLMDIAVQFIQRRLDLIGQEDFSTLLVFGMFYAQTGNYKKSLEIQKRLLQAATESNDPLLLSLSYIKMACNLWHLQKTEEARINIRNSLRKLEECPYNSSETEFSESTLRRLDLYKTIAYMHRILDERSVSTEYYKKALEIVKMDEKALVQAFKLETQIASELTNSGSEVCKEYCAGAYKKIQEVKSNQKFMNHHSDTVIHAMSRISHSLKMAGPSGKKMALEIREDLYEIAIEYLGEGHPEVARIAADTAYICHDMNSFYKEQQYIEKAEEALSKCDYKTDLDKTKLYCRELSDAWKSLGMLFSEQKDFTKAENAYTESLFINVQVYGPEHQRVARLYRSFGHLYKKWDKYQKALDNFQKCYDINVKFSPEDIGLKKKLQQEMKNVKRAERKGPRKNY